MNIQKQPITLNAIMVFAMVAALVFPCITQAASAPAGGKSIPTPSPDESRTGEIDAKERASLLALLKQWQDELEKIKSQLKLQVVQHEQWLDELKEVKSQLVQLDASPSTAVVSVPKPALALKLASTLSPKPAPSAKPLAKPEPASSLALTPTLALAHAPSSVHAPSSAHAPSPAPLPAPTPPLVQVPPPTPAPLPAPAPSSAPVPSSTPAPSAIPPAKTGTQENRPKPPIAVKQPVVQQDSPYLQYGLFAALGLLVILALWLGQRYYAKIKSRTGIKLQPDAKPIPKPAADSAAPKMAISPIAKVLPQAPPSQDRVIPAPAIVAPPKASLNISAPPLKEIKEEASEEDLLLEEAMLYASHGRPRKAVEMLLEIVKQHPSKAEAWSLLLSCYSSLAKAAEFEKTAREFLRHHKGSPLWRGMQALGRTLDKNNPLYADSNPAAVSLPEDTAVRQPIGDVLVNMGILSEQDLQNCLNDFDPVKDGRFGGYLVKRKAITLVQLDQALLQQQGVGNETKSGALPSLQELENLVADFDAKRDGSIGEFLASRNASTPEQLRQLLQQHPD